MITIDHNLNACFMKQIYFSRLALVLAIIFAVEQNSLAQCNCAWQYQMPITVTNAGSTVVSNYQVSITVNTAALVSAGKMLASGDDIRFTDGSCTDLPYWIESGMNTIATKIWIKVNSIPASGFTTIKMFYGNSSATAASSGTATFLFFDDFPGSSVDPAMWNTVINGSSTITVSGGNVSFNTMSSATSAVLESVSSYAGGPYYSEMNVVSATGTWPHLAQGNGGLYTSTNGACMFTDLTSMYLGDTHGSPYYSAGFSTSTSVGAVTGIWSFVRNSVNTNAQWPGGSLTSTTLPVPAGDQSTPFGLLNSGAGTLVVDWIRGREYYAAGTTQTLGAEVLNAPAAISGATSVCVGATTTLVDAGTGVWHSSSSALASVVTGTGVVTGASAGTPTITYTLPSGCFATVVVTVNAAPSAGTISGFYFVCPAPTTFSETVTGGTWGVTNSSVAGVTGAGAVSAIAPGIDTVTYSVSNSCGTSVAEFPINTAPCLAKINALDKATSNLQVFPNPSTGSFSVKVLSDITEQVLITVSDPTGRQLQKYTAMTNSEIGVNASLPAGIYFVSAATSGNRYVSKLVVE